MPLAEDLRATLIVPVPEAEPLVGHWRQQYDPPAPVGIPAHITLLFPFRPAAWLGQAGVAELAALLRGVPATGCTLAQVGHFTRLVYLAPEPADLFVGLTRQLSERYGLLPYGRAEGGITPHLTVARHEDPAILEAVTETLNAGLPLAFALREAWLMERDLAGRWHVSERFPFGG
jgi:2'-5' RNA ligase